MVSCAQINKRVYLVAQNSSIHNVRLSKVNEIILCATLGISHWVYNLHLLCTILYIEYNRYISTLNRIQLKLKYIFRIKKLCTIT